MSPITLDFLRDQIELNEQLLAGRAHMLTPQDLPGRFGRVVRAIDHVLQAIQTESVLGGGWAVWRHGFVARVTQDVDIALSAAVIDDFLRAASVSGFTILPLQPGRWPKLIHKETGIKVDILPEGGRPGAASSPAPTTIPAPAALGAKGSTLSYMSLLSLVELKIAAGRARDDADVVELVRVNEDQVPSMRRHVASVHKDYVTKFDQLAERARIQRDE